LGLSDQVSEAGSGLGDGIEVLHVKTDSSNRDGASRHVCSACESRAIALHVKKERSNRNGASRPVIALHVKTESGSLFFISRISSVVIGTPEMGCFAC